MKIFGYCRVSTESQNLDRQIQQMIEAGVEEDYIYSDKATGKNFDRKNYKEMKRRLTPNDHIYISDLSRLGRNTDEIKKEWKELNEKCGGILVLDMPALDTRGKKKEKEKALKNGELHKPDFVEDIVFNVLSWEVEYDRKRRADAQRRGIEIAKKIPGKYVGKPAKLTLDHPQVKLAMELYDEGKKNVNDIIKETGLTKGTFYRRLNEREDKKNRYNI